MHFNNKHSESSKAWLQRHMKDPFTKKAKLDGYRSRASYKLIEINDKYKIFSKDSTIIDIGASPGGWSEVVINICVENKITSKIIAIDLLNMAPIEGVDFICGDFQDPNIQIEIAKLITNNKIDIILNDMAPNSSGQQTLDHLRIMNLCESVLEFAKTWLSNEGILVTKIFKGSDEQDFVKDLRRYFKSIKYCKPKASRKESNEIYIVASGFNSTPRS